MDWLLFVLGTFCFVLFPYHRGMANNWYPMVIEIDPGINGLKDNAAASIRVPGKDYKANVVIEKVIVPNSKEDNVKVNDAISIGTGTNGLDSANASIRVPDKGYTASVDIDRIHSGPKGTDNQRNAPLNDAIHVHTGTSGLDKGTGVVRVPGKGYTASVNIERINVKPVRINLQDVLQENEFSTAKTGNTESSIGARTPIGPIRIPSIGDPINNIDRDIRIISESKVSNGTDTNRVVAKVTGSGPSWKRPSRRTTPRYIAPFTPITRITISWEDDFYPRSGMIPKPQDEVINDELELHGAQYGF